jgi:hypothetical protein
MRVAQFPYAYGRDLVLNWTNPADEDLAQVEIYRLDGKCPLSTSGLELDENDLLVRTQAQVNTILDFGLDNSNQTYCYLARAQDTSGNKSAWKTLEIIPTKAPSMFSFAMIADIVVDETSLESEDETTITEISTPLPKYEIVERATDYDARINSLSLMRALAGRFILLAESSYPANLYYVNPLEMYPRRYVLQWDKMFDFFGKLSLGIRHQDLVMIPECDSQERANPHHFATSRLLLDVDQGGAIAYFNLEQGGCRQSLTWQNMRQVLPTLALGINIQNLSKIPLGN